MNLVPPVLAQILLTFVMLLATGRARFAALRDKRVRMTDIAVASDAWPDDVRKFSNNYANQYETPVLFYVLVGIAIYIRANDILMVVLAWSFVATRVVHAFIHTGANDVSNRFRIFLAGATILMVMWVLIVIRLVFA
jgi:hypothetical protein